MGTDFAKTRENAGENQRAKVICDSEMNASGLEVVDVADFKLKVLKHFENLCRHVIVALSCKCQRQSTACPVEKRSADRFLNALDRLAKRGLCHEKFFCRTGNIFLVSDGFYIEKFFACHIGKDLLLFFFFVIFALFKSTLTGT